MAKVYALTSGKGGVGKTTVTANLGLALAKFGKKSLMIDADIAMPNLALLCGTKETPVTLYDLLSKRKVDIKQAIYQVRGKADILPCSASLEGFLRSDLDLIKSVIAKIREEYDFIIIDSPSGLSQHSIAPLEAADEVFLVTTPDTMAVSDALKMKTAMELLGSSINRIILNRSKKKSFLGKAQVLPARRIETELGVRTIGIIPEDGAVLAAAQMGKPIVVHKPNSAASKGFKLLAARLIKETMVKHEAAPEKVPEKPPEKSSKELDKF